MPIPIQVYLASYTGYLYFIDAYGESNDYRLLLLLTKLV